jgi:DNA-binding winged helix-turn-helix (wHTH) protein/TolB-like protein
MHDPSSARVRFRGFELDRRSGELVKAGSRLRLQEAPLRVLQALIERPGEIVTREELRRRLWPDDTFVDFDNGLNTAVNRLRGSLGDSAEKPKFVETVGRRGYRFIAALEGPPPAAEAVPPGAAVLMRLAVLPFRPLKSDPDVDFLAFGLADAVASALSGLESVTVRSPIATARFASDVPDLPAMAAALDITLALAGTVLRAGDRVRVSTQLLEAPRGTLLWTTTSEVLLTDLFQVTDTLVRRIVESLTLPLTVRDTRRIDRDVPGSGQAFEMYLRANSLSRYPDTWPQSRDAYLESVRIDPHYAPAWARLGRVNRLMAKYAEEDDPERRRFAEDAFRRALALNPELSLAHYLYAQLEMETGRSGAAFVRLLDRARERRADAQLFAGLVQAARYVGVLDASRAADRRARQLDPAIKTSIAHTSLAAGDYERAAAEAGENDDPLEALALALLGRTAAATEALEALRRRYGSNRAWAAYIDLAFAFAGGDRQSIPARAEACLGMPFSDPEGLYEVGLLLALSSKPMLALAALQRTVAAGFSCLPALDGHAAFRTLREDPAFESLRAGVERAHRHALEAFETAGGLALLT